MRNPLQNFIIRYFLPEYDTLQKLLVERRKLFVRSKMCTHHTNKKLISDEYNSITHKFNLNKYWFQSYRKFYNE